MEMFNRRRRKSKRRKKSDADVVEDGGVVADVIVESAPFVVRMFGRLVSAIVHALT
ncbi:hypothetical protein ACWF9G_02570 [Nocardia sp. NPDC055029]